MTSFYSSSFLAHASDINNLLEGLDGVLKDGFNRLHDTKSSFHVVDLRLHALNGFHFSSNLDKGLTIIKSLEDSGGKGFLNILNSSGFSNGGISITSGLGGESGSEVGLERDKELVFVHLLEGFRSGSNSKGSSEFHNNIIINEV